MCQVLLHLAPGHQMQYEWEDLFEICHYYKRKQKYLLESSAQSWHIIQAESHIGKFSTDEKNTTDHVTVAREVTGCL